MANRVIKALILGLVALGLIILAYKFYDAQRQLNNPLLAEGAEPVVLEVPPNSSALALLHQLKDKQLIRSKQALFNYIKWKKIAGQFKAGVYELKPGESALALVHKIVIGQVMVKNLTIVEGTNLLQVTKQLEQAPYLTFNSADFSLIAGHYPHAEGLLLADTYQYNAGSNARQIIMMANNHLMTQLNGAWQQRTSGLPYQSPYELLIVASILEKEAALLQEKRIISGIIANRLRKNMPLQMDPTVIYAFGANFHGKLTHADLAINSPYNTYRFRGLPPTPIAMVGKEAIMAAAQPEVTDYLYYVAKGDGTHFFSKTYEEQRHAISHYLLKDRQ